MIRLAGIAEEVQCLVEVACYNNVLNKFIPLCEGIQQPMLSQLESQAPGDDTDEITQVIERKVVSSKVERDGRDEDEVDLKVSPA